MAAITMDERRELVQMKGLTLDGKPAQINGRQLDFPVVRSAHNAVEFSWATAHRIAHSHKGFQS